MEAERYKCIKDLIINDKDSYVKGRFYFGYPAESKYGSYWKILVNDRLFLNINKVNFNNHFLKDNEKQSKTYRAGRRRDHRS